MTATVSDKVVLITGGAGGIGVAMVKELLLNGAKGVAVVDIYEKSADKAIKEISSIFSPHKITFIKTDVTIKEELEKAFEITIQTFQQLDIVINNAGIVDEINWHRTIAVNFTAVAEGTYLAMQKYLPKYKSVDEGVIVNTASVLGVATLPTAPMYCATKHAIVGLGRALGSEEFYQKYQVRILTICPGLVKTSMVGCEDYKSHIMFPDNIGKPNLLNPIMQDPERIGKSLIEVIARGKTGSLWVIEDDIPLYEIEIPDRKTMKVF